MTEAELGGEEGAVSEIETAGLRCSWCGKPIVGDFYSLTKRFSSFNEHFHAEECFEKAMQRMPEKARANQ